MSDTVLGKPLNLHNLSLDDFGTRFTALFAEMQRSFTKRWTDRILDVVDSVVLALPGAGGEHDQNVATALVLKAEPSLKGKVRIVDDTWAGLFAATCEERGICAHAGTGSSVCYATNGFTAGKRYKIDGWGAVIGDHGSALQMVIDFFRNLGRDVDLSGDAQSRIENKNTDGFPYLTLYAEIASALGALSVDAIQSWFDLGFLKAHSPDWPQRFAKVAIPITTAADRGEPTAKQLVVQAANGILESIKIVLERPEIREDIPPIVLQGGMFRNCRTYREHVVNSLTREAKGGIALSPLPPVAGALLLAAARSGDLEAVRASLLM